jgi:hypothetical protein
MNTLVQKRIVITRLLTRPKKCNLKKAANFFFP